jgi:hypothetical protein
VSDGGGRREKKERGREKIFPRSPRVSLILCVQELEDKRNKRERKGWLARSFSWSGWQEKKEEKRKKKKKKGPFGQNSFEF